MNFVKVLSKKSWGDKTTFLAIISRLYRIERSHMKAISIRYLSGSSRKKLNNGAIWKKWFLKILCNITIITFQKYIRISKIKKIKIKITHLGRFFFVNSYSFTINSIFLNLELASNACLSDLYSQSSKQNFPHLWLIKYNKSWLNSLIYTIYICMYSLK